MTLTRRKLLGGISALAVIPALGGIASAAGATSTATASGGQLCLGLYGPTYWGGFNPFLNWWKLGTPLEVKRMSGANVVGKAAWDAGFLSPSTGELLSPVPADVKSLTRMFFAPNTGLYDFSGEEWIVRWDGAASCDVGGLTQGGQIISKQPNSVRFKMGSRPGNTWLTFTITASNNPPTNIRVYQARYATNVDAGEKFNPDWLKQVRQFGILRFMDWMGTNNTTITDFTQLADESYSSWCQTLKPDLQHGPKASLHPALICQLANLTKCNIHVCIPHQATDAFVRQFATYFRDNLAAGIVVTFEYSNECWNWGFDQAKYCLNQGATIWPGDGARFAKWYGYRAAQCMKIVSDVFNDRARWRGCLATQTVAPEITGHAIAGVQAAIAKMGSTASTTIPVKKLPGQTTTTTTTTTPSAMTVNSLFNEVAVTGYFGDVQTSVQIAGITNSSPAVVTAPSHGFSNGTRLKVFASGGMTQLNNATVVVANASRDTFELAGVDATNYGRFAAGNNYAVRAEIFDLMDASEANFQRNPNSYPTKYSYFNQVLVESWRTGASGGISTRGSVSALKTQFWPAQKVVADKYGLELRQYEGGLHFVGDTSLAAFGGNPRFTEFLLAIGQSAATAGVYADAYAAFTAIGGRYPAKFVEGGGYSEYGLWAGMRAIPGDESNPVWQATLKANGGGSTAPATGSGSVKKLPGSG